MDKSLLVNTYIRTILCSDDNIKNRLIDSKNGQIKIFPVDARSGSEFPFVVIHRDSITPYYTKDGCYQNELDVTIFIVDTGYDKCVELANLIRNRLDLCRYNDNEVYIDRIELSAASEYISDNSFIQELRFAVTMAN